MARLLVLAGLIASWHPIGHGAEEHAFFHENVLGTSLELRVLADSPGAARRAEEDVLAEIDRLAAIFSGYDPSSEFRRWMDASPRPIEVSRELFEVLTASEWWRARSGGAFDPRVEAMTRLWSQAAADGREPTPRELGRATALLSGPPWRPGPATRSVERLSECPLTLNAIAKGYIVDLACTRGMQADRGVRGLVLNVGGDLRVLGEMSRTIGIAAPWSDSESSDPIGVIAVRDRAVSTSGASQRGLRLNGRWSSHIIDPRTGRPVSEVSSATVIAPRSMDADALATIANVLPVQETLDLVATLPGVDCLIVTKEGRIEKSPGWARYEAAAHSVPLASARTSAAGHQPGKADEPHWSRDDELVVNFEVNSPEGEGRRYRRPYVAIWIEDRDGRPVRTLTLWVSMGGAGPFQWIPDLRRWYKADQLRKQKDKREMVFTVARPTRPPGKYRVIWDGKDDQGKLVPAGDYVVLIDAAREHGTYQNLRKAVTIGGAPVSLDLQGGVEIRSATIEYRKKTRQATPR